MSQMVQKAVNYHRQQAFELSKEMRQGYLERGVTTYGAAISVCENDAQWLVPFVLSKQMWQWAPNPGVIYYNAFMSFRVRKEWKWLLPLELYMEMGELGSIPDAISYDATINACEKGMEWLLPLEP